MGQHKTSIHWERDTEHFNIKSFNRDHVIRFENGVVIHATSAPEFRRKSSGKDHDEPGHSSTTGRFFRQQPSFP
ncbi:MAG: hypothetical protein VX092_05790, partial [SAR324 cluster bacterium]|nr:hypothetical protein [SAR324 cluster bacterium]